ncbi:MAG TPA: hypothetical protein VMS38_15060 [Pseudorhodoferax sp.]|jgi:hypothetical protein|nr:hypothetical protein [Pseudorhodoferax sp.]
MRSAPRSHLRKPSVKAIPSSAPSPAPLVLRSRVSFVLYALSVIGCLSTITALIERAAP